MSDVHIPPEALDAGALAVSDLFKRPMSTHEVARAAFLAMIAAWPGMKMTPWWEFTTHKRRVDLILPLTTQEKPDGAR